jgi:hypothetical protein
VSTRQVAKLRGDREEPEFLQGLAGIREREFWVGDRHGQLFLFVGSGDDDVGVRVFRPLVGLTGEDLNFAEIGANVTSQKTLL